MNLTLFTVLFTVFGFLLSGTWIALSLLATAGISLELFTSMPVSKIWAQALWNSLNNWALAALPMFIFLGEIIMRTKMSELLFDGLKPWVQFIPGRLLHTNVVGSAIFAAVSGSSPATVATIGKITLNQLDKDGYDKALSYGSLAGAGTLGLLIPPSIVLIIYGVLGEVSIGRLFIAGVMPGILLAGLYSGYVAVRVMMNPGLAPTERLGYTQSAVSQQIAALERTVGEKVFDRPGGRRAAARARRPDPVGSRSPRRTRRYCCRLAARRPDI